MDLYKFDSLLKEQSLFFSRPDLFLDPFEGSIPAREKKWRNDSRSKGFFHEELTEEVKSNIQSSENGIISLHKNFKRGVVVNCWNISNNESDAMWRLYLTNNNGIAISTTVQNLYDSLIATEQNIGSSRIRYIDYEVGQWYHETDYPHINYNFLIPLFHKRKEFEHEKEFRLYYQIEEAINNADYWDNQPNQSGTFIKVNLSVLIKEIILSPMAGEKESDTVNNLLKQYGYSFPTRKSKLQSFPEY